MTAFSGWNIAIPFFLCAKSHGWTKQGYFLKVTFWQYSQSWYIIKILKSVLKTSGESFMFLFYWYNLPHFINHPFCKSSGTNVQTWESDISPKNGMKRNSFWYLCLWIYLSIEDIVIHKKIIAKSGPQPPSSSSISLFVSRHEN